MTVLNIGGMKFDLEPQPSPECFQLFHLDKESVDAIRDLLHRSGHCLEVDCVDPDTDRVTMDSCFENPITQS